MVPTVGDRIDQRIRRPTLHGAGVDRPTRARRGRELNGKPLTLDLDLSNDDPGSNGSSDPEEVDAPEHDEATWSVAELHHAISDLFKGFFASEIWVEGEIRNLNRSKNGHVYFDLIDSDQADEAYPPALAVVLFARDRQRVNKFIRDQGGNIRMDDGVRVRVRGRVGTYASRSSLQLRMSAIDPRFTLGVLEAMRKQVLGALDADGLLDRNAGTYLTPVPLRVAMVTSLGSAAHADAMEEFDGAGLGIELFLLDARVQGAEAGDSLAAAIRAADAHGVDVILVVRGGGARTDLAAFDLEVVARAIATADTPVFTGIGHEIDMSIADRVAYRSFKTPTATAAAVCDLVRDAREQVEDDWSSIGSLSLHGLGETTVRLDSISERLARSCTWRLERTSERLTHLAHGLGLVSINRLDRMSTRLDDSSRRTALASRRSLDGRRHDLDALESLIRARDPRLALARGWSIVRGQDGGVIRSPDQVAVGDTIHIETAGGIITSTVTDLTKELHDQLEIHTE